jgi:predicted site-specific integrase-resolvase
VVEIDGVSMTVDEWCLKMSVSFSTFRRRIREGRTFADALGSRR